MEKPQVLGDELREVREEGRIQLPFDARDVEAAVLGERMEAMNEQHNDCEGRQRRSPPGRNSAAHNANARR